MQKNRRPWLSFFIACSGLTGCASLENLGQGRWKMAEPLPANSIATRTVYGTEKICDRHADDGACVVVLCERERGRDLCKYIGDKATLTGPVAGKSRDFTYYNLGAKLDQCVNEKDSEFCLRVLTGMQQGKEHNDALSRVLDYFCGPKPAPDAACRILTAAEAPKTVGAEATANSIAYRFEDRVYAIQLKR